MTLYEKDFYDWTNKQAIFLRNKDISHLDIENLVEEIETLGRSEKNKLESYLVVLTKHLLKCEYQPEKRTKSWEDSIWNSRKKIKKVLKQNPSLKSKLKEILMEAYEDARYEAEAETVLPLDTFPEECPWTIGELLEEEKS